MFIPRPAQSLCHGQDGEADHSTSYSIMWGELGLGGLGFFWLIKDALSHIVVLTQESTIGKKASHGGKVYPPHSPLSTLTQTLPFDNWTNGSSGDEEASDKKTLAKVGR